MHCDCAGHAGAAVLVISLRLLVGSGVRVFVRIRRTNIEFKDSSPSHFTWPRPNALAIAGSFFGTRGDAQPVNGLLRIFQAYGVHAIPARSTDTGQAQQNLAALGQGNVAGSTISMLKVACFHEDLLAAGHSIVTAALGSPIVNQHRIRLYDAEQIRWVNTSNPLADLFNWTVLG